MANALNSPSLLVFGAVSKAPKAEYLTRLRLYLSAHKDLTLFKQEIIELPKLWEMYSSHNKNLKALDHGLSSLEALSEWVNVGMTHKVTEPKFGILTLPLLTIIEVVQYFQFLQKSQLSHCNVLSHVEKGAGVQGYCAGLLAACAVAVSEDETELVKIACKILRLAVGIGAYGDLGGIHVSKGPLTAVAARLAEEDQMNEIARRFPALETVAITDPKRLTYVGSVSEVEDLYAYARGNNIATHPLHLGGRMHSSDNVDLAHELIACCEVNEALQLPRAASFKVGVRSNQSGAIVTQGTLNEEIIGAILKTPCDWYQIMTAAAEDLRQSQRTSHQIIQFGLSDSVPLSTYHSAGLKIAKFDALSFANDLPTTQVDVTEGYKAPADAIAVVGMACRFPGANTTDEFWDLLASARSMAQEVPKERIDIRGSFRATQDSKWVGRTKFFGNFVSDVDALDNAFFNINTKEAIAMDPQQRILLETAYQAVESSGYLSSHGRADRDKVGVYIGASFKDSVEHAASHAPNAYTSTGNIAAFLAGKISHYFNWSGPAEVVDTACSASAVAIKNACESIRRKECSMALAGGVNIMTTPTNFMDLARAGFLSPTGQCKPFDSAADGYCRAEGVGLIFLKGLTKAEEDGDLVLGVIPGIASNQGSQPSAITIPFSPAQIALNQQILSQAAIRPEEVSYVEAHGTGTQAGDPLEIESIRNVYGGKNRETLYIGSVKGNIGHTETAAGVAGVIKALLMIDKGSLPACANHHKLNPKIPALEPDHMAINTISMPWKPAFRAICVNSYGAAGSNSALLVCQGPQKTSKSSTKGAENFTYPIIISARTKGSVQRYIELLEKNLRTSASEVVVGDLALSLSRRQTDHRFRLITTLARPEGLAKLQELAQNSVQETPREVHRVVLAFSGQSKRDFGVDKALYDACHLFRTHLDYCHKTVIGLGIPEGLYPAIFNKEPFSNIKMLQCSLFAIQYAYAQTWISSGLIVDAVVGHSFGELTALAVSGILSLEDALRLVAARVDLMLSKWGSEPGTMLAVHDTVDTVRSIMYSLPNGNTDLEIACYNAQTSQVVVGTEKCIQQMEELLRSEQRFKSIKWQRVEVTHGFHSRFTDPLLRELEEVAKSLTFLPPKILLESCTDEKTFTIGPERIAQHTRVPVYLQQAVQRLETRLGPCLWLEAGIDTPIISMVKKAVKKAEIHSFLALKSAKSPEDPMYPFAECVADLWRQGIQVKHPSFVSPQKNGLQPMWLPPYQFERTQHWLPYVDRAIEAINSRPAATVQEHREDNTRLKMVTARGDKGVFNINIQSPRFANLVAGHSVLGFPLCPAALYLECVAMAAEEIVPDKTTINSLCFETLSIIKPLGLDPSRTVFLTLEQNRVSGNLSFKVHSKLMNTPTDKAALHVQGQVSFPSPQELSKWWPRDLYQRYMDQRLKAFSARLDTETLKQGLVYKIFSRVVNYGGLLKGISIISLSMSDSNLEALAEIAIPEDTNKQDSTAIHVCDTSALETFLQVAGFSINCSELHCSMDEYLFITGADSIFISTDCDFENRSLWTVYTAITPLDGSKATADVYVLIDGTKLVATMIGVRFTKLPVEQVRGILETAHDAKCEVPMSFEGNDPIVGLSGEAVEHTTAHKEDAYESPEPREQDHVRESATPATDGGSQASSMGPQLQELLISIVAESAGIEKSSVDVSASFEDLGLDSLSLMDLASVLEEKAGLEFSDGIASEGSISTLLGLSRTTSFESVRAPSSAPPRDTQPSSGPPSVAQIAALGDTAAALAQCVELFDTFARQRDFIRYYEKVAPEQDKLMLAYIAEAFNTLGVDLWQLTDGQTVPPVKCTRKHERLMPRLWAILEKLGVIVLRDKGLKVRTSQRISTMPAKKLLHNLALDFPAYRGENELISLTGSRLADCIIGKADPVALLFGQRGPDLLNDYYCNSPQLAVSTDLLVEFMKCVFQHSGPGRIRILEIGGGFGGTTTSLASVLDSLDRDFVYTFSDVAPRLVNNAKKKFSKYTWMDFQVFNVENDPPASLRGNFDIVIGTNVVHATSDIVLSCKRIKSLLREGGCMLLSEVTRIIDWYDIVFGLLDGWWEFRDGREYVLQDAQTWMEKVKEAGFVTAAYSGGSSLEARTQNLILGSTKATGAKPKESEHSLETIIYKTVNDLDVMADIYFPKVSALRPMPIALMVHAGGFMTMSRSFVRPSQTSLLLKHGILPVSLDYRLVPEINVYDGAMTDIRDGLSWARNKLPTIARGRGLELDTKNVVLIGWSAGGQLAMSTAWMCDEPPKAILAFYAPCDFESPAWQEPRAEGWPGRSMSMKEIENCLPKKPIANYTIKKPNPKYAGMEPGDPRSELILGMNKAFNFVPFLLNGFAAETPEGANVSSERVASISALAQVRRGNYKTPTFVIHGEKDEMIPYTMATDFAEAMEEKGVDCGVIVVPDAKHMYDLFLKPGKKGWESDVLPGYEFLFKAVGKSMT